MGAAPPAPLSAPMDRAVRWVPFWPETSGASGDRVNTLFIVELALCVAILALVFGLIWVFCIRYRRGSPAVRSGAEEKSWAVEIGWTAATLTCFLGLFVWGAGMYVWLYKPPPVAELELFVVGKQWMWKVEHPGGQREIDTLHLPVGKTVRLMLASQDVIHSFFIPAFRLKHDVVPGTLEVMWLRPTETGNFALLCAEFCGTQHAHMEGQVVVMEPAAYATWLTNQGTNQSLAQQGEALFRKYGCSGCHGANSTVHAPPLTGLYGKLVHLSDGSIVRADERYIRDSILLPDKEIVAGYAPVMPSFASQLGEDEIMKLIAYIQSLKPAEANRGNAR
jgi:cytochrome c oxidase subunit 2